MLMFVIVNVHSHTLVQRRLCPTLRIETGGGLVSAPVAMHRRVWGLGSLQALICLSERHISGLLRGWSPVLGLWDLGNQPLRREDVVEPGE